MKNSLFYQALLLGAAALCAACSGSEDFSVAERPAAAQPDVWSAVMNASQDSVYVQTRGLFYGGNDGKRYYTLWDEGDVAEVYDNSGTNVGSLSPNSYGHTDSQLTGSLSGTYEVGDPLFVFFPSRALDYTNQDGSIGGLSLKYTNMSASTTVKSVDAENHYLDMENASFSADQAYMKIRLMDENGVRIHPTSLEISSESGKNVKTRAVDGSTVYFTSTDPLTITTAVEDGEYLDELFVAVRNENTTADTWHFKAYVGEDVYVGPSDRELNWKFADGVLSIVVRQLRKTTAVSTLAVADIDDQTFTGSPIEPAVTVQDGTTTLTQGTDYSVSYTDNTNVGTATVTVKGLADAGAVAATKYLGTKVKTFSIVKATPVITMETGDVELVNTATGGHTVTAVTIADGSVDLTAAPYSCSISYESSDPSVATVDAATGVVTGVSSGTCTITAKVAGTGNWNEATSQYTVRVSTSADATNTISTWGNGGSEDDTIKL